MARAKIAKNWQALLADPSPRPEHYTPPPAPEPEALEPLPEPKDRLGAKPQVDVLLDSGAYTAWRAGKPIKLDEYCDFLIANAGWIWRAVSLDVINPGNAEAAAREGRENYLHMRKRGLNPIPVWHVGESVDWLYRMLDDGADYIGLSASSIVERQAVDDWYALAFDHLVDSSGLPIVKTHAFGEGREGSIKKFPWYSADTASWVYAAQRTATVQFDTGHKMSCRKDGSGTDASPDINGLDDLTQAALDALLLKHGIDKAAFEDRGPASYILATYCAALYYIGIQERASALCPIHHHPQGFFPPPPRKEPALHIPNTRVFLVSGGNGACFAALAKAGHKNMLSSYAHIKTSGGRGRFGALSAAARNLSGIEDYVYDPIGTCERHPQIKRYHDLINQFVK